MKAKRYVLAPVLLVICLVGILHAQSPGAYVEGEFLVKFKAGTTPGFVAAAARRHGTQVLSVGRRTGIRRMAVPPGRSMAALIAAFKRLPAVEYAEPNMIAEMHVDEPYWAPNDIAYAGSQWHFDNGVNGGIEMEQAWGWMVANGFFPGGTSDVVVAVIDTGVAYEDNLGKNHRFSYYLAPDLEQTNFVPGYDFVNNDTHPNDDEGHGTHVTGTIAQSTNNAVPNTGYDYAVAGIAHGVSIMPIKVLDSDGYGTYADIVEGIAFAADNGADIINMSLGGPPAVTLRDAVAYAHSKGVTIICSAGNSSSSTASYPAGYNDYCISVSATDFHENLAYYSNYGSSIDIAAPGGDVTATIEYTGEPAGVLQQTFSARDRSNFGLYYYQGTSMAAPHVTGVAALFLSAYGPNVMGPAEVRQALERNADDLGAAGRDDIYGWGLLNAYHTLLYGPTGPEPPQPAPDAAVTVSAPVAVVGDGVTSTLVPVAVTNAGDADALDVTVSLSDISHVASPIVIGSTLVPSITPGATAEVAFDWLPGAVTVPETRTLQASASVTGDANGANDTADTAVFVTPYATNIAVVEVAAPSSVRAGQAVEVLVTTANQGTSSTAYDVGLADDMGTVAVASVTTGPGEENTQTFTWTAPATTGSYALTATATVTDGTVDENDLDNTGTTTVEVAAETPIHVAAVDVQVDSWGIFDEAQSTVTIVDNAAAAVEGALVTISWSGSVSGSDQSVTNATGQVIFVSETLRKVSNPSFTCTVTNVEKSGCVYDTTSNFTNPPAGTAP